MVGRDVATGSDVGLRVLSHSFWALAVPEPTSAQIGLYWTAPSESWKVRQNVVDFFTKNEDPHSLVYYVRGFM